MSEDSFSTRKIDADEMNALQALLDRAGEIESVAIDVTPDVAARVLALIPHMEIDDGSSDELVLALAVRQIFMAGLYQLESELVEES